MSEFKTRREQPVKQRSRPAEREYDDYEENATEEQEAPEQQTSSDEDTRERENPEPERGEAASAPPPRPGPAEDEHFQGGFDAETNQRYEEIKRGSTHISALQQMTMVQ